MDNTIVRTDVTGKPLIERRHVSFSAMNNFANCPRKFHAYDVAKVIKEPENEHMVEGHRVHKAMAEFIAEGTPLPPQYERYADWVTTMRTHNHDEQVLVEHKLACTFQLKPCEYFSRIDKVWLRAQADLLVINNLHALSVDWKTGKEPDPRFELLPPNFQLRLTAMLIFLHFPDVERVESRYVYLNQGTQSTFMMPKSDLREFIPQVFDQASGIQKAVRKDHWPPRPSGLCAKHCGVTACEYWGKRYHGG
jgi:hypothetical protein